MTRFRTRLLVALLAPAVLMASSGITLVEIDSVASASRASDDGNWPCKHHHCGCLNAEMCREHCCCFKSRKVAHSCCGSKAPAVTHDTDESAQSGGGIRFVIRAAGCAGRSDAVLVAGIHWLPTSAKSVIPAFNIAAAHALANSTIPSDHFPGLDPPPPRRG